MKLSTVLARLPEIREFLIGRGADVLEPTSPYEVLRFRSSHGVSVLYRNDKGGLTHTRETEAALNAFFQRQHWTAGVATKRRAAYGPDVTALLKRDGYDCFLCLEPLLDDITREHLVPIVHAGPDNLANKVLAHSDCNKAMSHKSVMEKIEMRERNMIRRLANQPHFAGSALGVALQRAGVIPQLAHRGAAPGDQQALAA